MKAERVYLGTWNQRTNLHLEEVYRFLRAGALPSVKDATFLETRTNEVRFTDGRFAVSLTEDGVMLVSHDEEGEVVASIETLKEYQKGVIDPALRQLFLSGAPAPKAVAKTEDRRVAVVIGRDLPGQEVAGLFASFNDESHSVAVADGVKVLAGDELIVIDLDGATLPEDDVAGVVRDLVFFREFERQLHSYLRMHRRIWDDISRIREARDMRYSDFPRIRSTIMTFQKTLVIVKARLSQMEDIMAARRLAGNKSMAKLLERLGMYNFSSLFASKKYVAHLWEMTLDYADDTLELMEAFYQENTQRELNALKIITLLTAITSFFGMNVAFPWDDSWHAKGDSTVVVFALVAVVSFAVYYGLRIAIHNRHFVLKENPEDQRKTDM